MESSDAIKTHAADKSEHIEHYVNSNFSVRWFFEVDKGRHIAHVKATGKNIDLFAESITENMYASIDQAAKRLEDQFLKIKSKLKD